MQRFYSLLLVAVFCWQAASANDGGDRGKGYKIGNITFKNAVPDIEPVPVADFKSTLVVPIKRAGNLIIIEAVVDSIEGNFILDTGAPYLVLNQTYFRDYPKLSDQDGAGGVNGESSSFSTEVHNFRILDLSYARLRADVTDLSFIENSRHIKVLGLLGTQLFSKFAITVDLAKNELYIQKVDKKGNIPAEDRVFNDNFFSTPFTYAGNVVLIKGSIDHKSRWFAFDSAAETSFLDYDKNKKAIAGMYVISRSKVSAIGGSSLEIVYARYDNLVIGGHLFMQNRAMITNLDKMSEAYGQPVDGILGYDFFARGIFTINFVKKEFEMYIYNNQ